MLYFSKLDLIIMIMALTHLIILSATIKTSVKIHYTEFSRFSLIIGAEKSDKSLPILHTYKAIPTEKCFLVQLINPSSD